MELCTARAISRIPHHHSHKLLFQNARSSYLPWTSSLHLNRISVYRFHTGLLCTANSSLRSSTSEETTSEVSQFVKDEPERVTIVEENALVEHAESGGTMVNDVAKEDSSSDEQVPISEVLGKFNIKLDSEDSYSILVFGVVALVALWLATAVISAIDSVPLFPKLLEIVGLGYTLWFTTRYLLYKESRDELAVKIEEIKQQVLGSSND